MDIVEDLNEYKLVQPREHYQEASRESHDHTQAGHLRVEKTFYRVAIAYYWPRMFQDVVDYVRRCQKCQATKAEQRTPTGMMGRRRVEVIAADIMGPCKK